MRLFGYEFSIKKRPTLIEIFVHPKLQGLRRRQIRDIRSDKQIGVTTEYFAIKYGVSTDAILFAITNRCFYNVRYAYLYQEDEYQYV